MNTHTIVFFVCFCIAFAWLTIGTIWFKYGESKKYRVRRIITLLEIDGKTLPPDKAEAKVDLQSINMLPKNYDIPHEISSELKRMVEREYVYITNWTNYQMINKVSGLASISFSVLALGAVYSETEKWLQLACSLLSIVFVSIILYLSPSRRVQQYLLAWQNVDKSYAGFLSKFGKYEQWNRERDEAKQEKKPEIIKEVNEKIETEAAKIGEAIDVSEQILSLEGE